MIFASRKVRNYPELSTFIIELLNIENTIRKPAYSFDLKWLFILYADLDCSQGKS